eukprot:scaffold177_cov334-Pavlova_lutheri.AAC.32
MKTCAKKCAPVMPRTNIMNTNRYLDPKYRWVGTPRVRAKTVTPPKNSTGKSTSASNGEPRKTTHMRISMTRKGVAASRLSLYARKYREIQLGSLASGSSIDGGGNPCVGTARMLASRPPAQAVVLAPPFPLANRPFCGPGSPFCHPGFCRRSFCLLSCPVRVRRGRAEACESRATRHEMRELTSIASLVLVLPSRSSRQRYR